MRGPGIPAGTVCDELMGTIDLLPTFASITGSLLPKRNKIDGIDASGLLTGKGQSKRNEFIYYTSRGEAEGIRQGRWKLLIKKKRGQGQGKRELFLFDLLEDMGETNNLASENPKMVGKLEQRMVLLDSEIEKNARSPWYKK
jgi:arylsulfatase A-like enzyme